MDSLKLELDLGNSIKRTHSLEAIIPSSSDEPETKKIHLSKEDNDRKTITSFGFLAECRKYEYNGDIEGILNRLGNFFCDHLPLLSVEESAKYALRMVDIAAESVFPAVVDSCLEKVLYIVSTLGVGCACVIMAYLIKVERRKFVSLHCRLLKCRQLFDLYEFAIKERFVSHEDIQEICLGAEQAVYSADQGVRIAAVNCLATLFTARMVAKQEISRIERVLSTSMDDLDWRVRLTAVKGLSLMARNHSIITLTLYGEIKKFCEDSSKAVRIEALHILMMFADRFSENEICARNNAKLRLVDDAFASMCHVINDSEPTVRAEAARLLGNFRLVSDSFLDQTLDKKLLNAMRMSKSRESASKKPQIYGARRRRYQASAEWSTGKKLGEDAPAEKTDEEQTSLIPTGACGAFVTALEDEYMIVRQAGVYSLGRLAADRPFLAAAALDHLADMFNDEIEEVRLDAIRSLTPLVAHGVLHKEQLETILTVLDDASPDSREALRVLLAKSTFGTPDCLRFAIQALLNCMSRYPIDRNSIFRCMSELGRHHPAFTQQLSDELFELHPVFDITEPALDDQFYLAKLILILNAASQHRPICPLLPKFAIHHYNFLRCSMPSLVPPIAEFLEANEMSSEECVSDENMEKSNHCTRLLLKKTYKMMKEALQASTFHQRNIEQRLLLRDIEALCTAGENVAGSARFLSDILLVISKCDLVVQIMSQGGDIRSATNAIDQGFELVSRLKNGFFGVDCEMLAKLEEIFLHLTLLKLSVRFEKDPAFEINAAGLLKNVAEQYNEQLKEIGSSPSISTIILLENIERHLSEKCISSSAIVSFLQANMIALPDKFSSLGAVSTVWAQILEPAESPTEPLRFAAGIPFGILVNILLHNFSESDVGRFRIKVEYPDQSEMMFCPRRQDYTAVTSNSYRLLCKVLVHSKCVWSDSAHVRLGCVMKISQCDFTKTHDRDTRRAIAYLAVVESPHSLKQAAVDMLIQPMPRRHGLC